MRVLLVDDDPDYRLLMRRRLELDGRFKVVGEADNGADAIAVAREQQPDAVVLDLAMPVMGGIEAMDQLAAQAPGSKVVVLSSYDAMDRAEEALTRGAFAYLEKSMATTQILNVLAPLSPPEFEDDDEG